MLRSWTHIDAIFDIEAKSIQLSHIGGSIVLVEAGIDGSLIERPIDVLRVS